MSNNKSIKKLKIKKTYNRKESMEQVYNLTKKLLEKIENMSNDIKILKETNKNLEDKLENIINIDKKDNIKGTKKSELKIEKIDLPKEVVLKALKFKNYNTILMLMREYYLKNNKKYPITTNGKSKFSYYCNNIWIEDTYAHRIVEVLFKNFQKVLMKYNTTDIIIDLNEFMNNQIFIDNLDKDKTKRSFVKYLKEELLFQT